MIEVSQEILNRLLDNVNTLNRDYSTLNASVEVLKNQMAELMWYSRTVIGGFLVLLISQFWQIIILRKNGKTK